MPSPRHIKVLKFYRTPPRLPGVDYRQPRTYFVTFCVQHREPVFSKPAAARTACDVLVDLRNRGSYSLYGYCVMPDHVHLVIKLAEHGKPLSRVIAQLKAGILFECRKQSIKLVWQRGYYDRVGRPNESRTLLHYVLQNPARAGLVRGDERYEYVGVVDPFW
jgi:REP element-mobilizing transposase RayT